MAFRSALRGVDRVEPVGVLALQGSVEPHRRALADLGVDSVEVRHREDLRQVERLILPGGESSTLWRLLRRFQLWDEIGERARADELSIFGTCAGAILLGQSDTDDPPPRLDLIDVEVRRNAYGRQVASFVGPLQYCEQSFPLDSNASDSNQGEGVFIRAPRFRSIPEEVKILAQLDGEPVAIEQGRMMAIAFHPELTRDRRLYQRWLQLPSQGANAEKNRVESDLRSTRHPGS